MDCWLNGFAGSFDTDFGGFFQEFYHDIVFDSLYNLNSLAAAVNTNNYTALWWLRDCSRLQDFKSVHSFLL